MDLNRKTGYDICDSAHMNYKYRFRLKKLNGELENPNARPLDIFEFNRLPIQERIKLARFTKDIMSGAQKRRFIVDYGLAAFQLIPDTFDAVSPNACAPTVQSTHNATNGGSTAWEPQELQRA